MNKITKTIRKFTRELGSNSSGASAIEYALLATLVSTAFMMGAVSLGTSISGVNESTASEVDEVIAAMTGVNPAAGNNGNRGNGNNGNGKGNSGN